MAWVQRVVFFRDGVENMLYLVKNFKFHRRGDGRPSNQLTRVGQQNVDFVDENGGSSEGGVRLSLQS